MKSFYPLTVLRGVSVILFLLAGAAGIARAADQAGVRPDPFGASKAWSQLAFDPAGAPPVSFIYGGVPSTKFLPQWRRTQGEAKALTDGRTQRTLTWTDAATGLELRIVVVEYSDFPAVEWTGYLKNTGQAATPLIEHLKAVDTEFTGAGEGTKLRTIRGDDYSAASYAPMEFPLNASPRIFQPVGGRPTDTGWPYYNIDHGTDGALLALGWPGQWQAEFARDHGGVHATGGQQTVHLSLRPGEEIRTPLVALLFWKGADWIEGQNAWRKWFLAHNTPRQNGRLPPTANMICLPGLKSVAATELEGLRTYLRHGMRPDFHWIDAGWYEMDKSWFAAKGIGTWRPDPIRFPHGIREVSDEVHSEGMKFVLWFEPERVYRGSELWEEHPDWLLKWDGAEKKDLRLLNLGNAAAREWITRRVTELITREGVDIYRQDFNIEPLGAWAANDAPDRQGMTENLHVQGYLAFWDTLLNDHPGMMIDSCASGGRRNDLETMRRSVPLLRSDYQGPGLPAGAEYKMGIDVFDGNQGHTYGLSLWLPYFGTGEYADDVYSARSHLCPWMGLGVHLDDPDWAALRRQVSDHRSVADLFSGDYYPLTPYTSSDADWIAWQFVRTRQGDGMVQAFRREKNPVTVSTLKLRGLKNDARYEFRDLDSGKTTVHGGRELMTEGLTVKAASPRTALIFVFTEVK
ncbi:MAG: Alpha-galactosidase [Verrucomicrobia bacterium]|nr:Alpha-galactosidase [Verrucomicrobiota bacterium]